MITSIPTARTVVCPVCGQRGIAVPEEGRGGRFVREVMHGWDASGRQVICLKGMISVMTVTPMEVSIFEFLDILFPRVTIRKKDGLDPEDA